MVVVGREGGTSKRQIRFSTQQFSASWPSPRLNVPVVDTALHSTYTVSTLHLERTFYNKQTKTFCQGDIINRNCSVEHSVLIKEIL